MFSSIAKKTDVFKTNNNAGSTWANTIGGWVDAKNILETITMRITHEKAYITQSAW